jgi:hypothetical protein
MRLPFLDHELVEAAFTIDSRVLFADGERLTLLKHAAASWLPPEALVDRRGAPEAGADTEWQARAASLLPGGVLVSRGLLQPDALLTVLASRRLPATRLLVGAELWARHWLEPAGGAP